MRRSFHSRLNTFASRRSRSYVLGGGAAPFTPNDIAGCVRWYNASAITGLANNDPVATWTDLSPSGIDATQSTPASRPTFQTNVINGLPVVGFDANAQFMGVGSLSALTQGEVFVLIKVPNDPALDQAYTGAWRFGTHPSNDHYGYTNGEVYDGSGSDTRKSCGNPSLSLAAWRLVDIYSATNDWAFLIDGGVLHSTATNTVGFSPTCYIGRTTDVVIYLLGQIAEVIVYDRKLTSDERIQIQDYIKAKYSLTF